MKKEIGKIAIIITVIALAAISRLVKHPFNFTPIVAMSLFAGCYLKKNWGILIPLAAMFMSDFFIGFYDWQVMASVYVAVISAFFIGKKLSEKISFINVGLAAVVSSVAFFLITNFAVWAFFNWYPHTLAGLINCFSLALPFFRNSFAGDLVYTGALFGAYEFYLVYIKKRNLDVAGSNI